MALTYGFLYSFNKRTESGSGPVLGLQKVGLGPAFKELTIWLTQLALSLTHAPTHLSIHHLLGASSELCTHSLFMSPPASGCEAIIQRVIAQGLLCLPPFPHASPVDPLCAHTQNHTVKPKQRSRENKFFTYISCD